MPSNYSKRYWFTFPTRKEVEQPVIWQMSQKFPDVVFDIRQASVQNEIGIMAVLLTGSEEEVLAAVAFCRSKGVQVDPIEKSVIDLWGCAQKPGGRHNIVFEPEDPAFHLGGRPWTGY